MPEEPKKPALRSDVPEDPIFAAARKGGFYGGLCGSIITLIVCFVCHYVFDM